MHQISVSSSLLLFLCQVCLISTVRFNGDINPNCDTIQRLQPFDLLLGPTAGDNLSLDLQLRKRFGGEVIQAWS